MTLTAATAISSPRRPALDRATAMRLAATEYQRYLEHLRELAPADWSKPTECPGWDVRAMATHVLGMAEMAASVRENMRQMRAARRADGSFIDALTGRQVAEHAAMRAADIVARFSVIAPRAARGRRRTPGIVRKRPMPVAQSVGGRDETWTIGYLVDIILTRDTWMHRMDSTRATGRPPVLTAGHDGVIVADVAAEWAGRHREPAVARLTGPAGGSWSFGTGGPDIEADAVEFCRTLSGRAAGAGLLAVEVPF
jgi:uncharacterized protein (TIGR03083 family)